MKLTKYSLMWISSLAIASSISLCYTAVATSNLQAFLYMVQVFIIVELITLIVHFWEKRKDAMQKV